MKLFYLDTSVQAVRIFYHPNDVAKVDAIFTKENQYKLYVSRYSWFEFYHTWILDLYTIMLAAFSTKNMKELLAELGKSYSDRTRLLTTISSLMDDDEVSNKEIATRAFRLLKYELKLAFYNYNGVPVIEVDSLSCGILSEIENNFTVYEEKGVPKVRFPQYDSCSEERANCNIVEYIEPILPNLKSAISAMEIAKRDNKFCEKGKIVLDKPSKARGRKCGSISDWLMITAAPKNAVVVTTDEDWNIIANDMGKRCIKIDIPPKYQKNQIKKAMMGASSINLQQSSGQQSAST